MRIRMPNAEALTGRQTDEFLTDGEGIGFTRESGAAIHGWTERLLVPQESFGKETAGAIRRYASKVTGLSLPQVTQGCDPSADSSPEGMSALRPPPA